MVQQRLYTEEQMNEFINFYNSANPREYGGYLHPTMDGSERSHNNQTTKNILNAYTNTITPIKLPSDEEAGVVALKISETLKDKHTAEQEAFYLAGFQTCAKWMRDKILNK